MKSQSLLSASLFLLVLNSAGAQTYTISDEKVPVEIKRGSFKCRDAIPDHGFGAVPASVSLEGKSIFDRTLRVDEKSLYAKLPNDVVCVDLESQLASLPEELSVQRVVSRSIKKENNKNSTYLEAELALELPIVINEKNLILKGSQDWIEMSATTESVGVIAQTLSYAAKTNPQSGTHGVGLACQPNSKWSSTYQLSIGHLSRGAGGGSNNNIAGKSFTSQEACEEVLDAMIKRFQAEDPGNWGTLMKVTRKLEIDHRYILDNQAKPQCQEIEVDTITLKIDDHKFVGVSAFPLKTVSMDGCIPQK